MVIVYMKVDDVHRTSSEHAMRRERGKVTGNASLLTMRLVTFQELQGDLYILASPPPEIGNRPMRVGQY